MRIWPFKARRHNKLKPVMKERILVFPKGTIVKFGGIPCELLQDTPYESAHYRAAENPNDR